MAAAPGIIYDHQSDMGRDTKRALQLCREGLELITKIKLRVEQFRQSPGDQAAHYALYQAQADIQAGEYANANTAAKASYDEIAAVFGYMDAGAAAIKQACAMHGG